MKKISSFLLKKIIICTIILLLIGFCIYKLIQSFNKKNESFIMSRSKIPPFISDSSSKSFPISNQKIVFWFIKFMSENPNLQKYYQMTNGNQIALKSEYGGDILGTITEEDTTTITKPDGNKVDIRQVIALFGPPPQATSNWINEFINTNPGAQKIKDRFKIEDRKLYILPENEDYFTLSNQQTGMCVNGEADSNYGNNIMMNFKPCDQNGQYSKFKMNNNGIIKNENNLCLAAYYNANSNGQPLNLSSQYCDQSFTFLPNGALKHNASGRCAHPQGGAANDGVRIVSWDDCNAGPRIQFNKKIIPKAEKQYIGYIDDAHIGLVKTTDGMWIPIGDIFHLIAGPGTGEGFSFFGDIGDAFKSAGNAIANTATSIGNKIANTAKDVGNKIASGTMTAVDWVEHRANDVANFAENAAKDVGSWAKNISGDALNWAKGAGQFVVKNLVNVGNNIGSFARNAANTIKDTAVNTVNTIKTNVYDKGLKVAGNAIADASVTAANAVADAAKQAINFLASFPEMAKQAVNKAIEWLKGASDKVWDAIKGPIGTIIDIVLEGTHCEYKVQRGISKLDAVKAIEPALLPKMRDVVLQFVKSILNTASGGILTPVLYLIMPFVEPYIAPHIDGLLAKALETNEATISITTIADPVVDQVAKISCQFLNTPDINNITFSDNIDDNTLSSNTEWL